MKFLSFKDYLIISRPIIFPLIFLCFLVALFFSAKSIYYIDIVHIIFILLLTFLLPFFTFSINDLEDFKSDKINFRKKNILFGKYNPKINNFKKSILIYNLLTFLILILFSIFFLKLITSFILLILMLIIYFYSAKPIRLKEILFIDSISNGLIAFLCFLMIFSLFDNIFNIPFKILAVSVSIMSYHLIAADIDKKYDVLSKHKTTATEIKNRFFILLLLILFNLPLFFITFSSSFKYLLPFNLLLIILYFFNFKKIKIMLFLIFILSWVLITFFYILKFI